MTGRGARPLRVKLILPARQLSRMTPLLEAVLSKVTGASQRAGPDNSTRQEPSMTSARRVPPAE